MRRRILAAMLSVTTLAVIGFGVPLAFTVERLVEESATVAVERAAVLATREVSSTFATDGDPVELPENPDGIQFGLYDTTGALVAGVGPNPADSTSMGALQNAVVTGETAGQLVVAVPVAVDERVVGVVRATQPTSTSDGRTTRILALLGALGIAVVAASGALAWVLAGRLSGPVARLRDAARRLGDGDFGIEIAPTTIPELDQAAEAMNATAARLGDLISRERAFSADASHQLRTPIAGMRAAIETELAFPRQDPAEVLGELSTDLDRLERTVTELLVIARSGGGDEHIDLSTVIAEVASSWTPRLRRHDRTLQVGSARYKPAALGNAAMLRHALDVLIDNALSHGSGTVSVDVTAAPDTVTVTVADEGDGFDEVDAGAPDVGGFGLPLAKRLVDAMGGRLLMARTGPNPSVAIVLRRAGANADR